MTNKYFTDENHKVRLSEEMALNALQLLEAKLDAAQSVSVPSFVAEFCTPMAVVSAWRKQMVQRFGVEVTNGPAFQRVFRMLLSDGGRPGCCLSQYGPHITIWVVSAMEKSHHITSSMLD